MVGVGHGCWPFCLALALLRTYLQLGVTACLVVHSVGRRPPLHVGVCQLHEIRSLCAHSLDSAPCLLAHLCGLTFVCEVIQNICHPVLGIMLRGGTEIA